MKGSQGVSLYLMQKDESNEEIDSGFSGEDSVGLSAELDGDPDSHVADQQFSEEEVSRIQERYPHTRNFMLMRGLEPSEYGDCREATGMLRVFMRMTARGREGKR